MEKVVFFNGNDERVADIVRELAPAGFEVACYSSRLSDAEKIEHIAAAAYVILHPAAIAASVLQAGRQLRLVQLLTAGYDKIDLALTNALGLPVATNGGANAWAVAEHAIALLLALYKRLPTCDKSVRVGTWRQAVDGFDTFEVAGKTVGIVGAGNIGRKVARRLKAFETRIVYYDPMAAPELEQELGACRASLDQLLEAADIVTLHAPLLPETHGMIGAPQLARMKSSAVLINTCRAELVDEQALVAALQQGQIAGAGLDVFHQEPIAVQHALLSMNQVILSPHTAGHAAEGWTRRIQFAWDNIQRVASGEAAIAIAGK